MKFVNVRIAFEFFDSFQAGVVENADAVDERIWAELVTYIYFWRDLLRADVSFKEAA